MKILLGFVLLISFSAFSGNEAFQKRFKIVRDSQGVLKTVKIRMGRAPKNRISVESFWHGLKREITKFQKSSQTNAEFEAELERIAQELRGDVIMFNGETEGIEERKSLKKSLRHLKKVDLKAVFAKIDKSGFIKKFQAKLKEAFTFIDPTIVARPDHSSFFYKRNVGNQVAKWAMNFIKDRFSSVPVLNTAVFVVTKLMKFVGDQRSFHQNIFLYYAENHSEKDLGLSKEEVDTIVSSIFESRIAVTGFQESKKAQANWATYGFRKFYKLIRAANAKRRILKQRFQLVGKRLGYAFSYAENEDGGKILNLLKTGHMFTQRQAVAFDFKKPRKVLMTRSLVYLAQVGLSFVPIPGILKRAANFVADSFYVDQGKTEGTLVGYLEDRGEYKFAKIIMRQSVNPFLFVK